MDGAGNVIADSTGACVRIESSSPGNVVQGNFIGTDISGTARLGGKYGLRVLAADNLVGGSEPGAGNLISANTWGIVVENRGNRIEGNQIGTDVTGTSTLWNLYGISVQNGATDTTIGGTAVGAGNLISGNIADGIRLESDGTSIEGTRILGNLVGTQADGSSPLGNGHHGILIESMGSTGSVVGGTEAAARNTIAFNGRDGIAIGEGATHQLVQGNSSSDPWRGTSHLLDRTGISPRSAGQRLRDRALQQLGVRSLRPRRRRSSPGTLPDHRRRTRTC